MRRTLRLAVARPRTSPSPPAEPPSGSTGASATSRPPAPRAVAAARRPAARAPTPSASSTPRGPPPATAGRSTSRAAPERTRAGRLGRPRAARSGGSGGTGASASHAARLERLQPRRRPAAAASTSARSAGSSRQRGLERGALVGRQLAQQVVRELVARGSRAAPPPRSGRAAARSPCTMRILTVPSGMPVAAAISRWLRPRVEAPPQHVGLLVGQQPEQVREAPLLDQRVERGAGSASPSISASAPAGSRGSGHAPAQVVDRARAGDRHEPRERAAAVRVVGRPALPRLEEHLLEDVLRARRGRRARARGSRAPCGRTARAARTAPRDRGGAVRRRGAGRRGGDAIGARTRRGKPTRRSQGVRRPRHASGTRARARAVAPTRRRAPTGRRRAS